MFPVDNIPDEVTVSVVCIAAAEWGDVRDYSVSSGTRGGIGFTYDPADGEIRELMSQLYLDEETFKKELQEYLKAPKMSLESMREILLEKLSGDSIRLCIDVKKDLTASDRKVVGKFLSWNAKGVKCSQIHGDWINFQYDISKAEFYSRINEHIFEPIGSVARGCEILNAVYPDTFTSVLYDATLCIFKVIYTTGQEISRDSVRKSVIKKDVWKELCPPHVFYYNIKYNIIN